MVATPEQTRTKKRILVVDDNPEEREIYRLYLRRAGASELELLAAETAEEARALFERSAIDCVLLDYRLPDADGLELLERLRRDPIRRPGIVIMTGLGDERLAVRALQAGAQDYLPKDKVTPELLRRSIDRAIEKVEMERQLERHHGALEQVNAELRAVLRASPVGILVAGDDLRVRWINETAGASLGLEDVSEAFGEPLADAAPALHGQVEDWGGVLAGDSIVKANVPLEGTGGRRIYDLHIRPIRSDRQSGVLLVLTDVTAHRRIEEELDARVKQRTAELEVANAELAAFDHSVSHDLRAPARRMEGFARALAEDFGASLPPTARDYLAGIERAGRHMNALIDGLLRLAQLSRAALHFEEVDLSGEARAAAEDLTASEPEREVEVLIEDGLRARADRRLLRIALDNLFANAWKYTREEQRPRLELGCDPSGGGAPVYFLRDNGVGFDPSYAHKLFHPFHRLHNQEQFEGSGIGLATVQRIVRRHGGRIWARSAPGEGATFFFTLEGGQPGEGAP